MIYLDVLDSVKTAHPSLGTIEWWQPQNTKQQQASLAIAHSNIMIRLLMGETISISNNQMIDSYGWLSIADKMSELDEIIPWAPFNFVYYEKVRSEVNRDSLRKLAINCFSDPKFEFSAWAHLDEKQKRMIAENLRKDIPRFDQLLKGFSLSMTSEMESKFEQQAHSLQKIYEYLQRWEKTRNVCIPATQSNKLIWPRMETLRDIKNGIKGKILDEICELVGKDRLEYRSDILRATKKMEINDLDRERLKMYLDRFYNEKLAVSVSNGRGEFTMTDHTPDPTIQEDMVEDALADQSNDPFGLLTQTVYDVATIGGEKKRDPIETLTWEQMADVLKDKELTKSAQKFQRIISEYYSLNPEALNYHEVYTTWLGKTLEQLHHHRELLAKNLGKRVIYDSGVNKFITYVSPKAGVIAGGAVGYLVGTVNFNPVIGLVIGGAAALASDLIAEGLGTSIQKVIESRAVGRYRTSLDKTIQIKTDEELIR